MRCDPNDSGDNGGDGANGIHHRETETRSSSSEVRRVGLLRRPTSATGFDPPNNEHLSIHQGLVFTIDPIAPRRFATPVEPALREPPLLRGSVAELFAPSSPFLCAVAAARPSPPCSRPAATTPARDPVKAAAAGPGVSSHRQRRAAWRSQPAPWRGRHDEGRRPALRGGARSVRDARIACTLRTRSGRAAGLGGVRRRADDQTRPESDERIGMQIDDAGESWVGHGRPVAKPANTTAVWPFSIRHEPYWIDLPFGSQQMRHLVTSPCAVCCVARRVCDRRRLRPAGRADAASQVPHAESRRRRRHAGGAPEGAVAQAAQSSRCPPRLPVRRPS